MIDLLYSIDYNACRMLRKVGFAPSSATSEAACVQRYINRHFRQYVNRFHTPNTTEQGNTIWVFWWQGEAQMPDIVRSCVQSIQQNKGAYRVVVLNKDNFSRYANIPAYILNKVKSGAISLAHFSDILRFELLNNHGGWWLDATIYVTRPIPTRKAFYTVRMPDMPAFVSRGKWSGFLWYMPKGHGLAQFMTTCLRQYWEKQNSPITYLFMDHLIKLYYDKKMPFRWQIDSLTVENPDLYFFQQEDALAPFCEGNWGVYQTPKYVPEMLVERHAQRPRRQLHRPTAEAPRSAAA